MTWRGVPSIHGAGAPRENVLWHDWQTLSAPVAFSIDQYDHVVRICTLTALLYRAERTEFLAEFSGRTRFLLSGNFSSQFFPPVARSRGFLKNPSGTFQVSAILPTSSRKERP